MSTPWQRTLRLRTSRPARARPTLEALEARQVPTLFVTTTADENDSTPDDPIGPDGVLSLREAILAANVGPDATIAFAFPGGGTATIFPTTPLPAVTRPVLIDGFSQGGPGYTGPPRVFVDGFLAGAGTDGLTLNAGNTTVRGLGVNNFRGNGLVLNSANNSIFGCYVGTDGTSALSNAGGIDVNNAAGNTIGGAGPGQPNVVSGNLGDGIFIHNAGATNNVVAGNRIGTTADGSRVLGNLVGVHLLGAGAGNRLSGNLVGGNTVVGVIVASTRSTTLAGNTVVANRGIGIALDAAGDTTVGGTSAGAGNRITANAGAGVSLANGAAGNHVYANTIDLNLAPGVSALDPTTVGNEVFANAIVANAGPGIDLQLDGVTFNDAGDPDAGPNDLQNFPVLAQAVSNSSATTVHGRLNSTAGRTFRLEFFTDTAPDPSGFGEGTAFLGAAFVNTDAFGDARFTASFPVPVPTGTFVSATATDLTTHSTSEFSAARRVTAPPASAPQHLLATGTDVGAEPLVHVYDPGAQAPRLSFDAYDSSFRGGVRVATAEFTGDGVPDVVTAPGPGGGQNVRIFDGTNGGLVREFPAYAANLTIGVFVAAADVNGDGVPDVITGADAGGGPHVKVFSGADGSLLREFFAYAAGFTGGVRVAAADVNGDGFADVITAAGPGGGPHVKVFSGADGSLLRSFFAYDASFTGGVYVAAGDTDGDGVADVITGAGATGQPLVAVYSGRDGRLLQSFFAYDVSFRGGVRVAAFDSDDDGVAEVITGAGPGGGPHVRVLDGLTLREVNTFFAYDPTFAGGVFVGGR